MQKQTIFETIPYEENTQRGTPLSVAQIEEALEDVFSDTSAFFTMPERSEILKVKSENIFGVYKLIVTLTQGSAFPEYMLSARVAELEPKLVNVVFESGELEKQKSQEVQKTKSIQQEKRPKEPAKQADEYTNIITQTCSNLGISYQELAYQTGYELDTIIQALSTPPSKALHKAIELYVENTHLKQELQTSQKFKNALQEYLNQ